MNLRVNFSDKNRQIDDIFNKILLQPTYILRKLLYYI